MNGCLPAKSKKSPTSSTPEPSNVAPPPRTPVRPNLTPGDVTFALCVPTESFAKFESEGSSNR